MKQFVRGQFVIYEGRPAYINFISDQYITVCIAESIKPPEEAEHSINPIHQVLVCVNSDQWDQILPDPENTHNRFSTDNTENVENIK